MPLLALSSSCSSFICFVCVWREEDRDKHRGRPDILPPNNILSWPFVSDMLLKYHIWYTTDPFPFFPATFGTWACVASPIIPAKHNNLLGNVLALTHCYSSHLLILHPRSTTVLFCFYPSQLAGGSLHHTDTSISFLVVYSICIDGILKDVIGTFLTFMTPI